MSEFRILFLRDGQLYDTVIKFSNDVSVSYIKDFYQDFKMDCLSNSIQLICMIPIIDGEYNKTPFIADDIQIIGDFSIKDWISSVYDDRVPVYKNGIYRRLRKC